ncbi:MAG: hypothetical protein Q7T14_08305, partial [Aestuariivirga sp.]|nr:hypothetical protein [Aestuariivirga sp.]
WPGNVNAMLKCYSSNHFWRHETWGGGGVKPGQLSALATLRLKSLALSAHKFITAQSKILQSKNSLHHCIAHILCCNLNIDGRTRCNPEAAPFFVLPNPNHVFCIRVGIVL